MADEVLVGVDGSPESRRAAEWALEEAAARRWSVRFANIFAPAAVADPLVDAAYHRAARRAADLLFEELRSEAKTRSVPAHCDALPGRASETLVQLSAGVGLTVVGRRPRTGFSSRMGSVSSALAAHSRCPTAVIPHDWPAGLAGGGTEPGRGSFAGQVVAAVEPGDAAADVLAAAADIAQRRGLALHAVTVSSDGEGTGIGQYPAELLSRMKRQYPDLACHSHTLSGKPAHEIAHAARDVWMLVVGTRGFSGLPGIVHGSVSQALLQHVSSPILVVPDGSTGQRQP